MKKLLIMSMVLLLGVASGFSQVQTRTVKTVKSKKTTVADINQKLTETKKKAEEAIKNKNIPNKGTVTRPSSNVGTRGDYVTDNKGGNDLILLKPGSRDTRVTRPSSNVGTRGDVVDFRTDGVVDHTLLKPGSQKGKATNVKRGGTRRR